jgi:hypothetical protein
MSESIQEMENQWALNMAARYQVGPKAGQRVVDCDPHAARDAFALRTRIEELKAVEAAKPQISQTQLDQLNWLTRARAAKTSDGKPLVLDPTTRGSDFRLNLDRAQRGVESGQSISDLIANTERDCAVRGVTIPATGVTIPATSAPVQAINTNRGPK